MAEISRLDVSVHDRWAKDQINFDPTIFDNAAQISSHADLAGTSSIYSSQLAELLETAYAPSTWAFFAPPAGYEAKRNRFFRSRLFPSNKTVDQEIQALQEALDQLSDEKEKKKLTDFLQKFELLNRLLSEVNARKLQYQKG